MKSAVFMVAGEKFAPDLRGVSCRWGTLIREPGFPLLDL